MIISQNFLNPTDKLQHITFYNTVIGNEVDILAEDVDQIYKDIKNTNLIHSKTLKPYCFYNPNRNIFNTLKKTEFFQYVIAQNTTEKFDAIQFKDLIFNFAIACQKKNDLIKYNLLELDVIKLKQYIGYHLEEVLTYFSEPNNFIQFRKKFLDIGLQAETIIKNTDFFLLVATNNDSALRKETLKFIQQWTEEKEHYFALVELIGNHSYSKSISKICPQLEKLVFQKTHNLNYIPNSEVKFEDLNKILQLAGVFNIQDYTLLFKKILKEADKSIGNMSIADRQKYKAEICYQYVNSLQHYEQSDLSNMSEKIISFLKRDDFLQIFDYPNQLYDYTKMFQQLGRLDAYDLVPHIYDKIKKAYKSFQGKVATDVDFIFLVDALVNLNLTFTNVKEPLEHIPDEFLDVYFIKKSNIIKDLNNKKIPIGYEIISSDDQFPIKDYILKNKEKLLSSQSDISLIEFFLLEKSDTTALEALKAISSDNDFFNSYLSPLSIDKIKSITDNIEIIEIISIAQLNNILEKKLFNKPIDSESPRKLKL